MAKTTDRAALDTWYVVGRPEDITAAAGTYRTRLLGQDLEVRPVDGGYIVREADAGGPSGDPLPVRIAYGHVWSTLGTPARDLFPIDEFAETDRRVATCGAVRVRASGLRLVENFLDMAHFPFVHTDILGAEEQPEVPKYDCEIRRDVDEVWATNCTFWQPQAAAHAEGGQMTDYTYRVATPFNVLLYKTCPSDQARMDVIALFIQPVEEDLSLAYAVVNVVDPVSTHTGIIHFQQMIFLQDRIILENQRPRLLPLSPRAETPTRADMSSIAFRRWLKEKGLRYGVFEKNEPIPSAA
ncbi:aromatic ring-hydroxylating oxygenase subunit alpha [Chthonobacter albigriseus]|uniref:aromatic ring-hydroxylating oxygenase subunit alpha n=1 Tax=Chthonobacter albigriseus TaxID=1683161 RepID=UPI0015EEC96F|nr:aromatic ring-hydroxylating dioxygenase subunit alpha [Chthonobacter albigriseus]